jgi:hypothetical protein
MHPELCQQAYRCIYNMRLPPRPHRDFAFYEENAHAAIGNVLTIQTRLLFAYHTCA